jgi:phenylacetate-coenzyme A ligase PaaK-like adenylate-forming protein
LPCIKLNAPQNTARLLTFKNFANDFYTLNEAQVTRIALDVFRFQARENPVYRDYLRYLKCAPDQITSIAEIPHLPVAFFKTHTVKTGNWMEQMVFTSSGTTGSTTSHHFVPDIRFYEEISSLIFEHQYGKLNRYHVLALLPSYQERQGSSLIKMMDYFIAKSESNYSGYFLNDHDRLAHTLNRLRKDTRKTILWGVTFALLDFAEKHALDLSHCVIMETGGMKGRRKESIREDIHDFLQARWNLPSIHSEYGMTELFSQAYSASKGLFNGPPWLKITLKDINDPFSEAPAGRAGVINVMDLANFSTCSFIETQDLGRNIQNGNFEVLGRLDNSDIRGCNLLVG